MLIKFTRPNEEGKVYKEVTLELYLEDWRGWHDRKEVHLRKEKYLLKTLQTHAITDSPLKASQLLKQRKIYLMHGKWIGEFLHILGK